MKRAQYLLFVAVFILAACTNSSKVIIDDSPELIGKWMHTESYMSTGGPGEWKAVGHPTILQLNTDGTVKGDHFAPDVIKYRRITEGRDSVLMFSKTDGSGFGKRYSLIAGKLYLSPYPQYCFEGCADKFEKIP